VNSWLAWAVTELEPVCCFVDEDEYRDMTGNLPPSQQGLQQQQQRRSQSVQPEQRFPPPLYRSRSDDERPAPVDRMQQQRQPGPPPLSPSMMGRPGGRPGFYNRPGRDRVYEELGRLDLLLGQKRELQRKQPPLGRGSSSASAWRGGVEEDDDDGIGGGTWCHLVGDGFSLADVAVASYLLYIPRNFPGTDLSQWPHLVDYMIACASRRGYAAAFGPDMQAFVLDELEYGYEGDGVGDDYDDDDRFPDRRVGAPPRPGGRGMEGGDGGRTMMSPRGGRTGAGGGTAPASGGGWDPWEPNEVRPGDPYGMRTSSPGPSSSSRSTVGPNNPLRNPRGAPPDPNGWTGPNGLGRTRPNGLRDDDIDDGGGRQLFSPPSYRR
jgi:hypothetical protein